MKTYIKTSVTTEPRLKIQYEDCPESPRQWSNLGTFITSTRNYKSPDTDGELEQILKDSKDLSFNNADEHARYLQGAIKKTGRKIKWFCMISKHEHGNVYYKIGVQQGWDSGVCGFYLVEVNDETKNYTDEKIKAIVEAELDTYNSYVNGEVYRFTLFDDKGEIEDSCSGFYDIEEIKDHLGDEWKNENMSDYLV